MAPGSGLLQALLSSLRTRLMAINHHFCPLLCSLSVAAVPLQSLHLSSHAQVASLAVPSVSLRAVRRTAVAPRAAAETAVPPVSNPSLASMQTADDCCAVQPLTCSSILPCSLQQGALQQEGMPRVDESDPMVGRPHGRRAPWGMDN